MMRTVLKIQMKILMIKLLKDNIIKINYKFNNQVQLSLTLLKSTKLIYWKILRKWSHMM
jgi:hypothetical protein